MQPLTGIRVLDLSQFLSGPRCGQILSYLGADVVKVEPPTGDIMRLLLMATGSDRGIHTLHAGKRGLIIDFRKEADMRLFLKLVRVADVLIDNSAPGYMEKLGLAYPDLSSRNPHLIYVAISGFGQTGPARERTAFDIIAQATGGAMHANHQDDHAPGVFMADLVSGAYAALGVMAALRTRDRTNQGQFIDISMQDVVYFQNYWGFADRAVEPDKGNMESILGKPMADLLSDPNNPMCFWNSFKTKDGHVAMTALTERQWKSLSEVTGIAELSTNPLLDSFVNRIKNPAPGLKLIEPWMKARTSEEVVKTLTAAKVPCGLVANYDQVNHDPQLLAREMLTETADSESGKFSIPGNPIKMSAHPWTPPKPGPIPGQHRKEIVKEWLGEEI